MFLDENFGQTLDKNNKKYKLSSCNVMGIVEGNILFFRLGKCVPFSTPEISKDMKEIKRKQPIFVLKQMEKCSLVDCASNLLKAGSDAHNILISSNCKSPLCVSESTIPYFFLIS